MKPLFFILAFVAFSRADDLDPQEAAELACASSTSIYELNSDSGFIESPNYPDNYPYNEVCQWYINPSGGIPEGQAIFLEVHDFYIEAIDDQLWVYEGEGASSNGLFVMDGPFGAGAYFEVGSQPVTLYFTTDSGTSYQGFRLEYYVGDSSPSQELAETACGFSTRPAIITDVASTIIETPDYPQDHLYDTDCIWTIHLPPNTAGHGMYLNVLDYDSFNELYIYFDEDYNGVPQDYFYGKYDLGYSIYNPESVMSLKYDGHFQGRFKLFYYPADPACISGSGSLIEVTEKGEIKSPGYPYDVPEDLSCRWLLRAPEGQRLLLTDVHQNIHGDGINCEDEYIEILDGEDEDALSLGKFCGDTSFGSIPSLGTSFQVIFRTQGVVVGRHNGFVISYEAI